jgi:phosphoadenosine phosphosulfate reductase
MNLTALNERYAPLSYRERLAQLFQDFDRVLVTSSFGATSAILLHLLHQVRPQHPVHVIDTHYLFKETHAYREALTARWNLNVVMAKPSINAHLYTRMDYTWAHQPDACCHVNKVAPMQRLKAGHDIWVSGLIGGLSSTRKQRNIFEWDGSMYRFHPLIDMDAEEAHFTRIVQELPSHPLESRGYSSVGCVQCTQKGQGRSGRWAGQNKTECGLHVFNGGA